MNFLCLIKFLNLFLMIVKLAYGFVTWQLTRLPSLQSLNLCGMLLVAFKAFLVSEHCHKSPKLTGELKHLFVSWNEKVQCGDFWECECLHSILGVLSQSNGSTVGKIGIQYKPSVVGYYVPGTSFTPLSCRKHGKMHRIWGIMLRSAKCENVCSSTGTLNH